VETAAYPRTEPRTRAANQRAFLVLLLGVGLGGTGVIALSSGLEPILAFVALAVVGTVLLFAGIVLLLAAMAATLSENLSVGRAVTAPMAAASGAWSLPENALRASILLKTDFARSVRRTSGTLLGLAILVLAGVGAGAAAYAVGTYGRPLIDFELLGLFALLGAVMLVLADMRRLLPKFLSGGVPHYLFIDRWGLSGPLYPLAEYGRDPAGYAIRSPWFAIVLARLPAPNQIPWRLVSLCASRIRDERDPSLSYISLAPARFPVWMRGLKINDGFLPTAGIGDSSFGYGLIVAVLRNQLLSILWMAFQGGSRLFAEYGQLTPTGQQATRAFAGIGTVSWNRPLNGPWFVSLPPPQNPGELASWFA
jgi:hypothetical protein